MSVPAEESGFWLTKLSITLCLLAPVAVLVITLPDGFLSLDGEGEGVLGAELGERVRRAVGRVGEDEREHVRARGERDQRRVDAGRELPVQERFAAFAQVGRELLEEAQRERFAFGRVRIADVVARGGGWKNLSLK